MSQKDIFAKITIDLHKRSQHVLFTVRLSSKFINDQQLTTPSHPKRKPCDRLSIFLTKCTFTTDAVRIRCKPTFRVAAVE